MTISSEEVGLKRKGGELWSFESQLEEKPGGQQQKVVLGVDGGGSSTRCVCVATPLPSRVEDLRSLALAETGASNRNSVGGKFAVSAFQFHYISSISMRKPNLSMHSLKHGQGDYAEGRHLFHHLALFSLCLQCCQQRYCKTTKIVFNACALSISSLSWICFFGAHSVHQCFFTLVTVSSET